MIEVLRKACESSNLRRPVKIWIADSFRLAPGRQSPPEEQEQSLQPAIREMIELLDVQAHKAATRAPG